MPDLPTRYFARMSYEVSRHHDRPVHILQPDLDQPYGSDYLMYCGREINHFRLVVLDADLAARDWINVRMCGTCMSLAPEDRKPDWL